jgi:hypothetical protein
MRSVGASGTGGRNNGFELVAVRLVATEPTDAPVAIHRLAAL